MPFKGSAYPFSRVMVANMNEVRAVYGLFSLRGNTYFCEYVGQTDSLRSTLAQHLVNPPAQGVTHVFVEPHATPERLCWREAALIAEFDPPANISSESVAAD